MKFEKVTKGSITLAISNIVPLIGVLLGYWNAFDIIFLYWLENIIIGIVALIRITISPDSEGKAAGKNIFIAFFFCLHYGFFTYGHGIFVASFFEEQLVGSQQIADQNIVSIAYFMLTQQAVQLTIIAMFLAHLIDLIFAYQSRKIAPAQQEMFKPYKRIIVLHMTIIFGGFLATAFDNTLGIALVMIGLKIFYDLHPPKLSSKSKAQRRTTRSIN
jgi:hypothetical protein